MFNNVPVVSTFQTKIKTKINEPSSTILIASFNNLIDILPHFKKLQQELAKFNIKFIKYNA